MTPPSSIALDSATNEPVGFVLGFLPAGETTAYVHYIFVVDRQRRDGIATALMNAFMEAVRSLGASVVTLFTSRATSFYESLGFKRSTDLFSKDIADYLESKGAAVLGASTSA
jgi:GNAT superfamily N-acetyltransferase